MSQIIGCRNLSESEFLKRIGIFKDRPDATKISSFLSLINFHNEENEITHSIITSFFLYNVLKYTFDLPVEIKVGVVIKIERKENISTKVSTMMNHSWVECNNLVFDCTTVPVKGCAFNYIVDLQKIEDLCETHGYGDFKNILVGVNHLKESLKEPLVESVEYNDLQNWVSRSIVKIYPTARIKYVIKGNADIQN